MKPQPQDRYEPRLRSKLPGRERWEVEIIRHRPRFAMALSRMLLGTPGIHGAEANALSGRILIQYHPAIFKGDLGSLLRTSIDHLLKQPVQEEEVSNLLQNPIVRLVERTHPDRALMTKAVGASVATALASFLPGWGLTAILDVVQNKRPLKMLTFFGFKSIRSQLWVLGAFATASAGLSVVIRFYQKKLWAKLASTAEARIRSEAFAHVESLDMAFFDNQTTGGLMHAISGNAAAVGRFLEHSPGIAIEAGTSSVIVVLTLVAVSPLLSIPAFLPLGVMLLTSRYFQKRIAPLYARLGASTAEFSGLLSNTLAGIATVKSFTAEEYESGRIRRKSQELRQSYEQATVAGLGYVNLQMGVFTGIANLTMAVGAASVLSGGISMTSFVALAQMIPMLFAAVAQIDSLYDMYQNAAVSAEAVLALFDTHSTILSGPKTLGPGAVKGEISYDHVTFPYQPGFDVLRDLSLRVRAGETVGIVGATGAGKTTTIKLLLRFYDPVSGTVSLDGISSKDLDIRDLRQAVSFVSQDVYLFDGTVFDNIAYGKRDATRAEVEQAAKAAEAHDFIMQLPQGYDTVTGERGQRLSTGQRQRVSIARAVIKNAPILLLDEATASVDNETEAAILRSIAKVGAGRSMIVIAHRLSTVRNAGHIYVMDEGRVREQGTHDELLRMNGLYASLWKVQTGSAG